jgi:hypothetical protein
MQLTITNRHGVVVLRTEDTREIAAAVEAVGGQRTRRRETKSLDSERDAVVLWTR